jgi:hypothetical protein
MDKGDIPTRHGFTDWQERGLATALRSTGMMTSTILKSPLFCLVLRPVQ